MRIGATAVVMWCCVACVRAPFTWEHPTALAGADSTAMLVIDGGGAVRVRAAENAPTVLPPMDANACEASVRTVSRQGVTHAVWWQVRADSTAVLLASSSADSGRTWHSPMPLDTLDRTRTGCGRPAPAIAASSMGVSVAYSMQAPEGTGVFFSHQMAMEGAHAMFHSPMVIVYGDRVVPVAIAADSDVVAIAYEEPSARFPRIDLALSTVQGHRFDRRAVVAASDVRSGGGVPRVALAGRHVAVAWARPSGGYAARAGVFR